MAKGAMALLAMLAPKKGSASSGEAEGEGSDFPSEGKISAAEDILAAIKKGDAMALSDALEAHAACCADMGNDEDEDEGPKSGRY